GHASSFGSKVGTGAGSMRLPNNAAASCPGATDGCSGGRGASGPGSSPGGGANTGSAHGPGPAASEWELAVAITKTAKNPAKTTHARPRRIEISIQRVSKHAQTLRLTGFRRHRLGASPEALYSLKEDPFTLRPSARGLANCKPLIKHECRPKKRRRND